MKRKKMVKGLMGVGIGRNEAAEFAKTYRKVVAAKLDHLFPLIAFPKPPEAVIHRVQPRKYMVRLAVPAWQFQRGLTIDHDARVKRDLARMLAESLVDEGMFKISEKEYDPYLDAFVYVGQMWVVMPWEVP